jgi:hypothetical protein
MTNYPRAPETSDIDFARHVSANLTKKLTRPTGAGMDRHNRKIPLDDDCKHSQHHHMILQMLAACLNHTHEINYKVIPKWLTDQHRIMSWLVYADGSIADPVRLQHCINQFKPFLDAGLTSDFSKPRIHALAIVYVWTKYSYTVSEADAELPEAPKKPRRGKDAAGAASDGPHAEDKDEFFDGVGEDEDEDEEDDEDEQPAPTPAAAPIKPAAAAPTKAAPAAAAGGARRK